MTYKIIAEKNLPESELELEVEISYETLLPHRKVALKKLGERVSIPGFRAGHVPENILIQKVGELAVLEDAAYAAIEEILPKMLSEKNLKMVGEPRVTITKLAAGNPLCFKLTISLLPEVKLPDYKKIAAMENAKKTEVIEVSEKEVEEVLANIRKSLDQNKGGEEKTPDKEAPEFTDEFVKKLGDFKDVGDFKAKVKENLRLEKEQKAREKKRLELAEAILKKTDTVVPKALIESELAKMVARFHDDVTRMGLKIEDYLKHAKKTEEDMRREWRPDAERRGKLQLAWNAIAEAEKLSVPAEEIDEEVKHLLEHYKNADPYRTRLYVTLMRTNEKVFEFLESQN